MKRALELADILLSREYPDLIADEAAEELGRLSAEADSLRAVNAELFGALHMLLATAGEINEAPDSLLEMALESEDQETRNQANAHLCARAAIASARKQENPHG